MMTKLHVISDLHMTYHEHTDDDDFLLPCPDLVILPGNNGQIQRLSIYFEKLCKKYPDAKFILNLGMREFLVQKQFNEIREGLIVRQDFSEFWTKNLYYKHHQPIELIINDQKIEIFCTYGYPHISGTVDEKLWKSTSWYRFTYHDYTHNQNDFKPKEAADVYHGHFPIWSTPELCRQDHDKEFEIVKQWLANPLSHDSYKILVTACSPKGDPCLSGIPYTMYSGIKPDLWVSAGACGVSQMDGCKLYGNSGSGSIARTNYFII